MITIPFEPLLFGMSINVHLILECLAFFVGFRYYLYQRKHAQDEISTDHRLLIIIGATAGAFIGSRLMGFLENPHIIHPVNIDTLLHLINSKTIMGGLFGGLLGVELIKKLIGEEASSGDLFTLPLILAIFIGRIGCFLSGSNEFTYGSETSFFMGMDLGDGVKRHPVMLYELIFLAVLFFIFHRLQNLSTKNNASDAQRTPLKSGDLFKGFMIVYFGFRFMIEFIKPNVFFIMDLSSIQWLCIVCWCYYFVTAKKGIRTHYAR